ncbi:flagellar FliJ family protein, partial [Pseudomonas syringae group genomosp. 7]|uniref:flagellar FliJ family protein n=1 Tax=Pseudomonas syringae group genomosp. 7 TaxID=251699 RepID=UPI00376F68F7
ARLAPEVEMAEADERNAAQRLGHFQWQVNLANNKLQELDQFRQDYQQQWFQSGSAGDSWQWHLGYQSFLSQLDVAVA